MNAFVRLSLLPGLSLVLSLAAALSNTAEAQVSHGGTPPSSYEQLAAEVETVRMPDIDVDALRSEDATRGKNQALRYGALIEVGLSSEDMGNWETMANGDRVWRVNLSSPGALSLSVVFSEFRLPKGGQLYAYDQGRHTVLGAYIDLDVNTDGGFAFQPIAGDEITLEYLEPVGAEFHGRLRVGEVIHDYRGVLDLLRQKAGEADAAGACEIDINCPQAASYQDKKRATVRTIAGGGLCTAALINDAISDGTQYMITAYHCGSMNSVVAYLNYEHSGCNTGGTANQTLSGSTLMVGNSGYDYRLVKLTQTIPASYKPYYLGWDRTGAAPSSTVTIHHPQGDVKKISFDNNPPSFSGSQWRVAQWDLGVTEPGSSGCPLMTAAGRFIGQLYGGASYCGFPFDDYYGRFDLAWPGLKPYLDPNNANPTTINGYDPYGTPPTPPSITGISPGSVQAFLGGSITLTGNNFTGATQVKVGTTTLTPGGFSVVSNTSITFFAPPPVVLGPVAVTVTTSSGTSNALNLTYIETNPSQISTSPFAFANFTFSWSYGGGANDTALLGYSLSPATLPFGGFQVLASFSLLKVQNLGALGLGGHTLTLPVGSSGITFYSQVGTLNGGTGTFAGASSVTTTSIF